MGVFSADNFCINLSHNSFILINVSIYQSIGTHWTLVFRKNGYHIFADPLGQNLTSYKHLHHRLVSPAVNIQFLYELLKKQPIQKPNSILCGLFCIYTAHYLFSEKKL